MRALLVAAPLSAGCINFIGFPPAGNHPGLAVDTGDYFAAPEADCDVYESEPNDGDENDELDFLTAFSEGQALSICGGLSSISVSGDSVTGDVDYFYLTLLESLTLRAELTWPSTAELYFSIYDSGSESWDYAEDEYTGSLDAGAVIAVVYGIEGSPTDYTLALTFE